MDAALQWSTAAKFENWVSELLDYLIIYNVDLNSNSDKQAIAYTSGYLDGVAKEVLRTWRDSSKNNEKSLIDLLNELRDFCVPANDTDKLWEQFHQVKQTVNGCSKPIQEVATDLQTLKMRIPALSNHQLYYELKNAMDPELSTLVASHINLNMHWNAIVELAMKYDENRKK